MQVGEGVNSTSSGWLAIGVAQSAKVDLSMCRVDFVRAHTVPVCVGRLVGMIGLVAEPG